MSYGIARAKISYKCAFSWITKILSYQQCFWVPSLDPWEKGMIHLYILFLFSHVQLCVTPWTAACQASLSLTISCSLPKFMFIASVKPSNRLILCCPLLLTSVFPSISVFFQWISSFHQMTKILKFQLHHQSFQIDWFDLLALRLLSGVFSSTAVQRHQFSGVLPS